MEDTILSNAIPDTYSSIYHIPMMTAGTFIRIRGRIDRTRSQAKIIFLVLRQEIYTIQCIYFRKNKTEEIESVPRESVVDIVGTIKEAIPEVKSCTINKFELEIVEMHVVSLSDPNLPIQIDEHIFLPANQIEHASHLATRLNHRTLDLRRADNKLIFKIQAFVGKIIRKFLDRNGFMEIHSPKLIAAASEGGSNVFEVNYFGQDAYLAQSPQLFKQMAICADFPRVYEIGPIFRAEKSYTHRHLTEFTGIDLEMTINTDYTEILSIFDKLFTGLFNELNTVYGPETERFRSEFGIEPFEFVSPSIKITFAEAVDLLRGLGFKMGDFDDFDHEKERALGWIIKKEYHTDFFMVDKFPTSLRPFYTMPDKTNPLYSNSYDFFMRGEEILSGAQRIHDHSLLTNSATAHGIDITKITDYLDAFRYGVFPHGGGGIGLERVVMLYLGINNIRNVSLFPRDPSRITP